MMDVPEVPSNWKRSPLLIGVILVSIILVAIGIGSWTASFQRRTLTMLGGLTVIVSPDELGPHFRQSRFTNFNESDVQLYYFFYSEPQGLGVLECDVENGTLLHSGDSVLLNFTVYASDVGEYYVRLGVAI